MQTAKQQRDNTISAKELVLSFIEAMNDENFDKAKTYAADNMVFQGVLGTRNNAADYFKDMKKMKFKYAVQKVFTDGNDVCLWYDISMGPGLAILSSGWYRIEDGKISSFKVIFDPRQVLEQSKK